MRTALDFVVQLAAASTAKELVDAVHEQFTGLAEFDEFQVVLAADEPGRLRLYRRGGASADGVYVKVSECPLGSVLESGEPVLRVEGGGAYGSMVAEPLRQRERVIGAYGLLSVRKGLYGEREAALLREHAATVGTAVVQVRMRTRALKRANHMSLISDIAAEIVGTLDQAAMLDTVVKVIHGRFSWYDVSVFLLEEGGERVKIVAHTGSYGTGSAVGYTQAVGVGMVGWCAKEGKTIVANDVSEDPHHIVAFPGDEVGLSEMCVPLKIGESVVGVINVESAELGAFDDLDVAAMETVARLLGQALKTCQMYRDVQHVREFNESLLRSLPMEVVVVDSELTILAAKEGSSDSSGAAAVGGMGVVGRKLGELYSFSTLDMEDLRRAVSRSLAEPGSVYVNEFEERTGETSRRLMVRVSPVSLEGRRCALVVVEDVTEARRAEATGREALAHLRYIMDHVLFGSNAFDKDGTYTLWGGGTQRLLGYTADEMVGKRTLQSIVVGDFDLGAYLKGCLEKGRGEVELVVRGSDGRKFVVVEQCVPLYNERGEHIGFTDYMVDITRRREMEEALRDSERKYRLLVDNLPQRVFFKDKDLVYVSCNKRYAQDLGISPEAIAGKTDYDFHPKELADRYRADDARVMKTQRVEDIEEKYVQGGREYTIHTVKTPVTDGRGNVIGVLGIFWDVTEQKRAEEALRQEKEKLDLIVRAAEAGLALIELDGRVSWANEEVVKWFAPGRFRPGMACRELYGDGEGYEALAKGAEGPRRRTWTASHTGADGIVRFFRHTLAPLTDARGALTQYLRITWDVTSEEQKIQELSLLSKLGQAMQAELELGRLLRLMLTCVTAGPGLGFNRALLFIVDPEQEVLRGECGVGATTREEAYRIWRELDERHLSLDTLLTKTDEQTQSQSPLDQLLKSVQFPLSAEGNVLTRVLKSREALLVPDCRVEPGFPPELWQPLGMIEVLVVPIVTKGRALGVLVLDNLFSGRLIKSEDIRLATLFANAGALALDNAAAYQRLERSLKELKKAQDQLVSSARLAAIGEMAAHVAHEIRSPLVTIGGFARQMLKQSSDTRLQLRNARIIAEEVSRLERLLGNVLDFTQPSAPRRVLAGIEEVLTSTVNFVSAEARERGVRMELRVEPALPKTLLDPAQIRQVLLNLIRNAFEAMDQPDGWIGIRAYRSGNSIKIEVDDNGCGIAKEDLQKVFIPFFTKKQGGTGIGLAACDKIITDHGGTIEVESELGEGTKFTITLPIVTD